MLRTDIKILADYWKSTNGRSTLASAMRGNIFMDSADLAAYKQDGQLVGTFHGIPIKRLASLENDTFAYKDSAGNTLFTNVT